MTLNVLDAPGEPLPLLAFPDSKEAACFLAVHYEGREQADVATSLNVHQSTVSRMVSAAKSKIEALKASGRFDVDEIDRLLRKLAATGPVVGTRVRRRA